MKDTIDLIQQWLDEEDFDLDDEVSLLAEKMGWELILNETLQVLGLEKYKQYWYGAASIIYFASLDGIEMPIDNKQVIARLYWCLSKYKDLGENSVGDGTNLVWSIATNLVDKSYMSEWNPLKDQTIVNLIESYDLI